MLSAGLPPYGDLDLLNITLDFLPRKGDFVTVYFADDGYFYFEVKAIQFHQSIDVNTLFKKTTISMYFGKTVYVNSYGENGLTEDGKLSKDDKYVNQFLKDYGTELAYPTVPE